MFWLMRKKLEECFSLSDISAEPRTDHCYWKSCLYTWIFCLILSPSIFLFLYSWFVHYYNATFHRTREQPSMLEENW